MHARWIRFTGALSMAGGAMWFTSFKLAGLAERRGGVFWGLSAHGWEQTIQPAAVLMMAGLVGFHQLQRGQAGRLGFVGFVMTLLALAGVLAGSVIEYRLGWGEIGWVIECFSFLLFLPLGLLVLGLASTRARVLPPWSRALPLVIGILLILLFLQGIVVLLLTGRREQEAVGAVPVLIIALAWIAMGFATWVSAPALNARTLGRLGDVR